MLQSIAQLRQTSLHLSYRYLYLKGNCQRSVASSRRDPPVAAMVRYIAGEYNTKSRKYYRGQNFVPNMKIRKLFDATHGVKKRCQSWHRVIQPLIYSMPCLASFFDAMSGVKKLAGFIPEINCPTSEFEPTYMNQSVKRNIKRRPVC